MKKLILIAAISPLMAHAQVASNGEWQFPTSVRTYCMNIEQGLVAAFKGLIENNRKIPSNTDPKVDTRQLMAVSEAMKESIKASEESWYKLGCASILYSAEKKR